jgi:hypothetical protein
MHPYNFDDFSTFFVKIWLAIIDNVSRIMYNYVMEVLPLRIGIFDSATFPDFYTENA